MEINLRTSQREEFIDITQMVRELVNLKEGVCIVYCPHTTSGLAINEGADPAVRKDIIDALKRLVPDNLSYRHREGNSPAHIKASLIGNSLNILIVKFV
jgi:secondary thiamine-phosphate synthase enzyme